MQGTKQGLTNLTVWATLSNNATPHKNRKARSLSCSEYSDNHRKLSEMRRRIGLIE